jgi:hypothetical protein
MFDDFKYPSLNVYRIIRHLREIGTSWEAIAELGFTYQVAQQFTPRELQDWFETEKKKKTP